MKVTLNWLRQYVDFPWSPEELSERLTMLGIEVEGMKELGGEFKGVVVAQVITREKHPNADKLSLCRVNDGTGERQIVCGAQNFAAGDKVPLILPGASLPAKPGETSFTIKVGKIRGIESQGMMCSPQELGLPDQIDGLLILPTDAQVGQPFAAHLGRSDSDVIYDLEITPNRPDLNSVIGIAREISALTGHPLRLPVVPPLVSDGEISKQLTVRVEDSALCPRYTARLIRGIKIGPSPVWLKSTLEKVGIRSINNVVDITNFVLLECGQPLHAFDFNLLQQKTVIVRRATEGESFTTLDGQKRSLTPQMLMIGDTEHGIALAGVMGGQNSEINLQTSDVLLESACFQPQSIRATSKKLDLRSDASYRFERGADIGICDWASRRAAQLMVEIAGGTMTSGVIDIYPQTYAAKSITLRYARTNQLLGVALPVEAQVQYLRSLGLEAQTDTDSVTVTIPSFRVDLKQEVDLIEEIARLYGVDRIPVTPPMGVVGSNKFDSVYDELGEVRSALASLGLSETQGQTLISAKPASLVSSEVVELANPLSSDMNVLRPSLLPGLLDSMSHNLHQFVTDVRMFEVGRVFTRVGEIVREERRVAIAITGRGLAGFWSGDDREARLDLYDLKGILEELLETIGLRGYTCIRRSEGPSELYLESATVQLGKQTVGEFGQLLPSLAKQYDLRDTVFLAELNLDMILARRNGMKSYKPLPVFPSIRRDVAMIVSEGTTHEAILAVVRQVKPAHFEKVDLFDVFRGKNVPEGSKSVAYAFTYRSAEKTLTDQEVNPAHERVVAEFKQKLSAIVRE